MSTVAVAVLASGRGSNFEALVRGDTGNGRITLLLADNPDAPALARAREMGVEGRFISPGDRRTRFGLREEGDWAGFLLERGIGLVCLAGLMRILKGPLLEAFDGRIMNIHPSLLPAFPGLEPQRRALEHGVKVSGCTVHYVDRGTDTGPIILQAPVPVLPGDTVETLSGRILAEEHRIYPEAVRLHCRGRLRRRGRVVTALEDSAPS
jgi:phosphoribosylglycinamide formyltransferase-1